MAIEMIHTYLVHPGKATGETPQIGGTEVVLEGKLFRLLEGIYSKSDEECDIEISFNPRADGKQENPSRDTIIEYIRSPSLESGRKIAERLEKITDQRSGLGLLFLITGKEGLENKVIISRFPADSAILAEEDQKSLTVEFLERVFMKSATAYKAAAYQDSSLDAGFWRGRAVDKQINSRVTQLSNYWISEFLDSDFLLTPAAGTRRLAGVLSAAIRNTKDVRVKSEIAAAATLARNLAGKTISIHDFEAKFNLSEAARLAIESELRSRSLAAERFQFELVEFMERVAFRSIELSNGGTLTAPSGEFDEVFQQETLNDGTQNVRFSTEGKVIGEKLRRLP